MYPSFLASVLLLAVSGSLFAETHDAPLPPSWIGLFRGGGLHATDDPPGFKTQSNYMVLDNLIGEHLQPWAEAKRQATDWDTDDTGALCQPDGLFRNFPIGTLKIMEAPGKVVIVSSAIETTGVRRVFMNSPHPEHMTPTWNGDSRGKWDGDTLVVDTIGFNDKSWLMSDREPHTEALHLIERMRLVANDTYLEIVTTVEDPKALKTPYTYSRYYHKMPPTAHLNTSVCNEDTSAWRRMKENAEKAAAKK